METKNNLLSGFMNSHHDYRPAVMWFWCDTLVEAEITAQMESFKKQGVNDFFVNHVWGSTDEYLGERFFEMIKYTVEEAKRLGLNFWIYDEFNWPSGVAGGYVIQNHPETKAKMIQNDKFRVLPRGKLEHVYVVGKFERADMVWATAPGVANNVTDEVTVEENDYGFWFSYENTGCEVGFLHIISNRVQEELVPACQWGKASTEEKGFVDNLDRKAIRLFIDYTHERYKEVIGDEFGKTVKGIFTDEICVASHLDMTGKRVPWNDAFKENFLKKYGYSIEPYMYVLTSKAVSPEEKKARFDYWRLVTDLAVENHLKQVREWCDKENLLYTGHFCMEESLEWTMFQSGDIFDMMEVLSLPGIDSILSRYWIDNEDYDVTAKTLASCSRFFNRERTLCETYTLSSNQLRYDEMQRIANRLLVLGVNMIQYMGAGYSQHNGRRCDCGTEISGGPCFGDGNTTFERIGAFGDYVSRIQWLSAKTKPAGKVLLLSNQAGVFANFDGQTSMHKAYDERYIRADGKYEVNRLGLTTALLEMNVEYDMFGDNMADRIQAADGVATLCGCEYDAVILPNVEDTPRKIYDMIERLRKGGVRIIFADELPQLVLDEAKYEAPFGEAPKAEGVTTIYNNVYFLRLNDAQKKRRGSNGEFKAMLEEALGCGRRTLDIRHNGNIYTGLRKGEGATVVFMCNDANEERKASIAYREGMQLLDPATGNLHKLECADGRADICFAPHQMYVLIEGAEPIDLPTDAAPGETVVQLASDCALELVGGNRIVADWKFTPYEYTDGAITVPEDGKLVQLNNGRLPGEYSRPNATGLIVFDFEAETLPEKMMLVCDNVGILRFELNGERIDDKLSHCRFWGPFNAEVDVAPQLKLGKNRLAMVFKIPNYNIPYCVPFAFMSGEFELDGNKIVARRPVYKAAPLNAQGCGEFCGEAKYIFNVSLTAEQAAEAAFISVETREATELFVNGRSAGVRLWDQHFNVEGLLKEGENEIIAETTLPMWNFLCKEKERIDVGLLNAPKIERKL